MQILNNKYINSNGYIDLDEAINKGHARIINDVSSIYPVIYDKFSHQVYFFKSSNCSGGVYLRNKEIYETLISRLIKKYAKTVEYHPAKLNRESGVISLNWDYTRPQYITFRKLLTKMQDDYSYGSPYSLFDRVIDFKTYKPYLREFMTEKAINQLQIAPQHYFVGNLDYKPDNIAVENTPSRLIDKVLHFDYSFNAFSVVENYLKLNNDSPTETLINEALGRFWRCYFNVTLGMGATKNFNDYNSKQDFLLDLLEHSKTSKSFRCNMEDSLKLTDTDVKQTINELRENEKIRIPQYVETIIRQTIDINREDYSRILKNM